MANPALLFLIVSGFAVTFSNSWGIAFRLNLAIHPILGLYFSVLMFWYGARRFRQLGPTFPVARWMGLPIALSVLFAIPGIATPSAFRFYLFFSILTTICAAGIARLMYAASKEDRVTALLNYTGFGVWILSFYSGLVALTLGLDGGIPYVFYTHRVTDIVFSGIFLLHIGLEWAGALSKPEAPAGEGRRRLIFVTQATAVAVAAIGVVFIVERLHRDPSFTVHLSTIPMAERRPEERQTAYSDPSLQPVAMELVNSCLNGAGCHKQLEHGFRESNHNISLMTPHIQKNMDLMASEIGEENAAICLGCHAPAALFNTGRDRNYYRTHDNFSCTVCHAIQGVSLDPDDKLRSTFTVAPPVRHLDLYVQDGKERELDWLTSAAIRMNPLGHGRVLSGTPASDDVLCVACHHHQIGATVQQGLFKPRCIECHMQQQSDLGMAGTQRNHFMPGANQLVPLFANRPAAAGLIADWIGGKHVITVGGWENRGWEYLGQTVDEPEYKNAKTFRDAMDGLYKSYEYGFTKPGRAVWISMVHQSESDPVAGKDFTLDIITSNVGMEHPFPAAPLDLAEVWMDVRIEDSAGRILLSRGQLDANDAVPPDASRLGGAVVNPDGSPVEHYRVWRAQKNVIHRQLGGGENTKDALTFPIPSDAVSPMKIKAYWRYRKLSRDFLTWAYGPDMRVPILQVGSLESELPFAPASPK